MPITITIPSEEIYDEIREEFIKPKETTLKLEHSLVSISKWEAKHHKPFLSNDYQKTDEEVLDYIRCMTITQNVDPDVYYCLSAENRAKISAYIEDPMTATVVPDDGSGKKRRVITNELIYYWMLSCSIPVEFQTWHLSRLLTLIRVCNYENMPEKKMTREEILAQNARINAQRKAKLKTKG